ncbi:MAG: PilC/PilY family type IV pilus protein [Pseudorhodoferax sp.]
MRAHPRARRALLSVLIAAIGMPSAPFAAQLSLAQYPAGSASRAPAPNVVLTLDDSGSMGNAGTASSGMRDLKVALHTIFNATTQVIPDNSIRLGWNTFNKCKAVGDNTVGCNGVRVLDTAHRTKFLDWVGPATTNGSSTTNLYTSGGNTPTHAAYTAAGNYFVNASTTDSNGPWAATPGATAAPVLSCRRNYIILMTDGEWNVTPAAGIGNYLATTRTLPDGTHTYDATSAETKLYRPNASGSNNKLADLAFYFWATDLASGLTNNLKPLEARASNETFTTGTTSVTLTPFWNPRNDPATWQHVQTYTIGFRDAAAWSPSVPRWDAANGTYGANGDYPGLVTGAVVWPNPTSSTAAKKMELWNMALAGRGRFIPATDSNGLVSAFQEIFGQISADNSTPVTGFANSSSSIAYSATTQYTSSYVADGWSGAVRADSVSQDATSGAVTATPDATWGTKSATPSNMTTADKLNALAATATGIANRLILSWRDLTSGGGGTSFEWAEDQTFLSTAQKNLLKESTATTSAANTLGQQRLNFIRGDRSLEGTTLRTRTSVQGDIVNSSLWYVADPVSGYSQNNYLAYARKHAKRLPMVYVGGNDGMLHGFSGVDGTEKIAYVPKGVLQNLPLLTRSDYTHRYYVDGSPFSGDVFVPPLGGGDRQWQTWLFGTLGAGGKGYFVLDVTNPGSSATDGTGQASTMLKANAATLVVMDKTSAAGSTAEDADLGHIMVPPVLDDDNALKTTQIVYLNDGRWAAIMGNGYNSTNERPVLLIQYLDGSRELFKIVAKSATGTGNGLSAPRLVDLDGNGTPDLVYAGDLLGNLWKFDISSATATEWNVAFSGAALGASTTSTRIFNGTPLYQAVYTSGGSSVQPITAPPLVRANARGATGLMVAFGTGRNVTEGDRTDTSVQSIYSVLDNTRYKLVSGKVVVDTSVVTPTALGSGVEKLQRQEVSTTVAGTSDGTNVVRTFYTVTQNDVAYSDTDASAKKGWYMNLPISGERVLAQMYFYDESNNIELISEVPASGGSTAGETCAAAAVPVQKYRTLLNIMDGKKPSVQVMDTNGDGVYNAADGGTSRMTASAAENRVTTKGSQIRIGTRSGSQATTTDKLARMPEIPLRPSWRQLQ